MSQSCCFLIAAGGTGGHIFPAMAVARSLIEKGAQVHWLGTENGMEHRLVSGENIPLHLIPIKGFRGKKIVSKLMMPLLLCMATIRAMQVIKKVKAQTVIGFGGYVAAPGGLAARLLGKQLIIHEQNSVAGTTNKLLSKIATHSLEAFPNSLRNANRVGNPVRTEISDLFAVEKKISTKEKKKLLVMGGSLGALAVNQILPEVIARLPESIRPDIWHQAGKDKLVALAEDYREKGIQVKAEEFIDDVAAAYRWADIIICRAGALTVSEIAVAGIPAIFIPYPYAIDNHQFHNAQWLVENDAAYLIEQKELNVEKLGGLLERILSNTEQLKAMSVNVKKLATPDATHQVVKICEQACKQRLVLGEHDNAA